jgi:hypothetical protein
VLPLQTELLAKVQLLLADAPGLVEEVQRQVGLDQVQPRGDGQREVAQAVEDVGGRAQQVEGSAVAPLPQGQVAEIDVDASERRVGALLGVDSPGRAVQDFRFPQAVQVGQRGGGVVVERREVARPPEGGDGRPSAIEQPQRAGVVVLLEVDEPDELVEHGQPELLAAEPPQPTSGPLGQPQRLGASTQAAQAVDRAGFRARGVGGVPEAAEQVARA